jgi:hypothetical protein
MHSDSNIYNSETEYFFIGDGRLTCAIQWSKNHEMTPYGLILQDPEKRARKDSSLLFHPEFGFSKTTIFMAKDIHQITKTQKLNGDMEIKLV